MSGKGSKPRPFSVSQEHYASEWDRIFKKDAEPVDWDAVMKEKLEEGLPTQAEFERQHMCRFVPDALAGSGDTFEEKVSLSDEMQLHGDKHKPEGL